MELNEPIVVIPRCVCRNNFEKGMRDEFVVESADVGKMLRLQIGHDNRCGG